MIPYTNPLAYKQLRTWQQANEILELTEKFIKILPQKEPARDHMDRSARSTVRNIEEGFRRTTTQEYINFLGFSAGSNEELLGDYEHCLKHSSRHSERSEESQRLADKGFWLCKGESTMLHRQIMALQNKMVNEKTMTKKDLVQNANRENINREKGFDQWLQQYLPDKAHKGDKKGGKGDEEDIKGKTHKTLLKSHKSHNPKPLKPLDKPLTTHNPITAHKTPLSSPNSHNPKTLDKPLATHNSKPLIAHKSL